MLESPFILYHRPKGCVDIAHCILVGYFCLVDLCLQSRANCMDSSTRQISEGVRLNQYGSAGGDQDQLTIAMANVHEVISGLSQRIDQSQSTHMKIFQDLISTDPIVPIFSRHNMLHRFLHTIISRQPYQFRYCLLISLI